MPKKKLLDSLFHDVHSVILSRQNPVTGLLPASTAVNTHGDYTDAWVRDNVYSIQAVWALGLAYRRAGEPQRSDELQQATIKLMRGLLQSMMRQADKVEKFKHTMHPLDSLHAKYDTQSGLSVVADDSWGHLQIDATSIFLLMLAQMTASGLRIVFTADEVDFVQNLLYYISGAYRTPDYGIWERGNKINNGKPEINASSVGMAKAALQALDGFNLFGENASSRAVVHSPADAITLARNSLAALLPRESLSKEVDSALLSVIGYPAFAIGDQALVTRTRDAILNKLGGNYGCKRFLWDGHQTSLEDESRLHYELSELANFEHVESEWPLFFCYLYLNALFAGNESTAAHYRKKIESVMVEKDGQNLIPELYYLKREHIAAEKQDPGSQPRVANDNLPLVWAQSLYYTGLLLDEGCLTSDDLDPLRMRRRTTRFQRSQVALVVLAENKSVKARLAENGVIAETLEDIFPYKVISAPHLVEAFAQVGANDALKLSGRPRRRLLSMATSQTYEINKQKCLCLSWIQSDDDDYRMGDAALVASKLKKEIRHIRKHWLYQQVAVFTIMVSEELSNQPNADVLYKTLQNLQLRNENDRVGYASVSLAYRASKEDKLNINNLCITPISSREVSDPPAIEWAPAAANLLATLGEEDRVNYELVKSFLESYSLDTQASAAGHTVRDLIETVYRKVSARNHWLCSRLCFVQLAMAHPDLADSVSEMSVRNMNIVVGHDRKVEQTVPVSSSNQDIVELLKTVVDDPVEHCLLQEMLGIIGSLQRTNPEYFTGLRSIQLHNLLRLCTDNSRDYWAPQMVFELGAISPDDLMQRVSSILDSQRSNFDRGLRSDLNMETLVESAGIAQRQHAVDTDWFQWRVERGLMLKLDNEFLTRIWTSLSQVKTLIFGDAGSREFVVDCELTRSSMTAGEEIFAQLIDDSIQQVHPAYLKAAIVEVLYAYILFTEQHNEARFGELHLEELLERAAKRYCESEYDGRTFDRQLDVFLMESPTVLQRCFIEELKCLHAA